jgi:hypothetical protein
MAIATHHPFSDHPNVSTEEKDKSAVFYIAEWIRSRSREGRLVSQEEIFQELTVLEGSTEEVKGAQLFFQSVLAEVAEKEGDIHPLCSSQGDTFFFSTRFMDEAYARLLSQKDGDPLDRIAELVRRNSALYPRPTPLEIFEHSPFDMTGEEVQICLTQMMGRTEYGDIKKIKISGGDEFLFSTRHLEPDYALALAEWITEGLAENP